MEQSYNMDTPITHVGGSYYEGSTVNDKVTSKSSTLDSETQLLDPSILTNFHPTGYKVIRRLSAGSKLSNSYYIGAELRICNDCNKKSSSRPVLRDIIDRRTGEPKVLKIISKTRIPPSNEGLTNWRNLCEKLMNIGKYNNLMKIEQVWESDSSFYAVTEKLVGGELFEFLLKEKAIPEDICKYIMRQILQAVNILHSKNLLHRDIKPENIMFRNPTNSSLPLPERYELVLIDFDTCKMTDYPNADKIEVVNGKRRLVGTYGYLAPEILRGEDYTTASDLWSVGIVLYILMTGIPPISMDKMYDAKASHLVLMTAEANGIDFNMPPLMEFPLARDLCKRLLCFDRKKRISSAADALAHPWLTGLPSIFDRDLRLPGSPSPGNNNGGGNDFENARRFLNMKRSMKPNEGSNNNGCGNVYMPPQNMNYAPRKNVVYANKDVIVEVLEDAPTHPKRKCILPAQLIKQETPTDAFASIVPKMSCAQLPNSPCVFSPLIGIDSSCRNAITGPSNGCIHECCKIQFAEIDFWASIGSPDNKTISRAAKENYIVTTTTSASSISNMPNTATANFENRSIIPRATQAPMIG